MEISSENLALYLGTLEPCGSHLKCKTGINQADPVSPVTLSQLMSHALHFLHPLAAETALAMVNLEVGLDYWLPGDATEKRAMQKAELARSVPS